MNESLESTRPRAPTPRPASEALRYIEDPRGLTYGGSVKLLHNGKEAFPAWLDAIEGAQQRISMEMYIFADDKIGRRFGEALARAAARGVTVRLLYDFIGCRDTSPRFWGDLRKSGVRTIVYHRYRFWRPRFWSLFRRNHRKTLVVDGKVAFTGGLNVADEWLPAEDGGGDWQDAAVEVRGPAVTDIETVFLDTWNRREKRQFRLDTRSLARAEPTGASAMAVIANRERRERFTIRRAALWAMRASRRRVYLANPYFVPDRGILRALKDAVARGVDVRVVVPFESDSRVLDHAARATFDYLVKHGVRVFQHPKVLHSKVLLVDDDFVSIGSYNLDHFSLAYNLELVVNALDAGLARAVVSMFEGDFAQARVVDLETLQNRGPLDRLLEFLAYALRKWL